MRLPPSYFPTFPDTITEYVVQGHRFNLYEGVGCMPALYNTALMYVTTAMWPVVLGLCSAVYCGKLLALRPSPPYSHSTQA